MMESVVSKFELRPLLYALCLVVAFELGYAWYFNSVVLFYYSLYDFVRGAIVGVPLILFLIAMLHVTPNQEARRQVDPEGERERRRAKVASTPKLVRGAIFWTFDHATTIFYFAAAAYLIIWYPSNLPAAVVVLGVAAMIVLMVMRSLRATEEEAANRWRFDIPSIGALSLSAFLGGSLMAERTYATAFLPGNFDGFKCADISLPKSKIVRGLEHGHLILVEPAILRFVSADCETVIDLPVRKQGLVRLWYGV